MTEPPAVIVEHRDGWHQPPPKYIVLGCPKCSRTVAVLEGCSAWCTRCPGRPEMERSPT
jgi:hypothetical protein